MTLRTRRRFDPSFSIEGFYRRFDSSDPSVSTTYVAQKTRRYDHTVTDESEGKMLKYIAPHYLSINQYDYLSEIGCNTVVPGDEHTLSVELQNFFPPIVADLYSVRHLIPSPLDLVSYANGGLATKLLAKTNPSKPEVSLPAFLGELKDLPHQIYDKGRKALSSGSSLGNRFGILPMVSDVLKMFRLSSAVDKKAVELRNMYKNGGAQRKRELSRTSLSSSYPVREFGLDFQCTDVTTQRVWGTCFWKPVVVPGHFTRGVEVNRAYVSRLLLGISEDKDLTGYARDVWELIPFSWLADWFGNVGDYLDATQGSNLFSANRICLMAHTTTTRTLTGHGASVVLRLDTKERVPATPTLAVTAPFLTPDQTLTLIGLADRNLKQTFKGSGSGPVLGPVG